MKNLPKHTDGFLTEEVMLECQVNSHKAIVHWYKGEDQIEVSVACWENDASAKPLFQRQNAPFAKTWKS